MTDIICPLCGKPNPPDLDECKFCQAPLKAGGFIAPSAGEGEFSQVTPISEGAGKPDNQATKPEDASSIEQAIPDWLKETEAGFLEHSEPIPVETGPDQLSEQI